MVFQETHVTDAHIQTINMQFQATQSLWTHHCGLLSFSPSFILSENLTPSNPRMVLSKVSHPQNFYAPFHVLVLYAPASSGKARREFFDSVLDTLTSPEYAIDHQQLIILGDFNYSYHRANLSSQTSLRWVSYLDESFYNVMHCGDNSSIPTFRRNDEITSTIDYIFISNHLRTAIQSTDIHRLHSSWTDHQLLSLSINLGSTPTGFGLWRANPLLVKNKEYRSQLKQRLQQIAEHLPQSLSLQDQWDHLKLEIRKFTRSFAVDYSNWRSKSLRSLQRKRNAFLRSQPPLALRLQRLPVIDRQIESLQQELVDISALKAGIRWREHGEKSAGYLKRIHHTRTTEQTIVHLQEPVTGERVSSQAQLLEVSKTFYQDLYSVDPIHESDVDRYLSDIDSLPQLSHEDQQSLISPITIDDILYQSKKVLAKQSSSGADGLGYAFIHLIYCFKPLQKLIVKLYNAALLTGMFPSSWQDIRVRLLPKKGDLSSLLNWRPISLINCDAKIYTRVINQRMRLVMEDVINRYQTGFLADRFIAENGMVLNILMEQAHVERRREIGLLLDQEKAYDRVHPTYLRQTMLSFGFPESFVQSIGNLFFGNEVRVNVNGYFTDLVQQQRGLRQGDPLSPLLFNIALEPLLRHVIQDPSFTGFVPTTYDDPPSDGVPSTLKVLAYADDVCVFLHSFEDYHRLQHHLNRYSLVSNAKVNIHKTEAFSLDGRPYPEWIEFFSTQGITKWHDHTSPSPLRYLGFPLIQSLTQRRYLEGHLLQLVKTQCDIYSQRQLSIRGRATIANSLILSKIWYVLRLVHLPKNFFKQLRSIVYQFVWRNCKPSIKYAQLCSPLQSGGLGLLDPLIQQHNLQIRWIEQLLADPLPHSCSQPYLLDHMRRFHSAGSGTRLAMFFPSLRAPTSAHSNNFMVNIFAAMDSFGLDDLPSVTCNVATLFVLPLSSVLALTPEDYWTTKPRHSKLKVSQYFTFDSSFGCIRPQVSIDHPTTPRLAAQLLRDVQNRTVKLNNLIWPLILQQNQSFGVVDDTPFVDLFLSSRQWITYKPKLFRFSLTQQLLPADTTMEASYSQWQQFWKLPVEPAHRSLWYRLVHKKMYSQAALSQMTTRTTSAQCHFCSCVVEDIQHLIVRCPRKWAVWIEVFNVYSPHLYFSQDDICSLLWSFKTFHFVDNPELWTLCCSVLAHIWRFHWRHIIQGTPFTENTIVKIIMSRFATLKRSLLEID
ncbi:hypothetical protein G6F20_010985 [Rhizopus arrhizus]|nr:hypothetical protein G6F20_010985 [Rhizopus arrhizus]